MAKQNFKLIIILVILFVIPHILIAIGSFLDPFSTNPDFRYQKPSLKHFFGTDYLGRDLFARTIYAAGLSIKTSMMALLIGGLFSFIFGSVAGFFYNKLPDKIISWISSIFITVPTILILSAVLSVFKPGLEITYLIVGVLLWPLPARLVKGEIIQIKNSTFILAERALGIPKHLTILKSIPLVFYPALANLLFILPELVTLEVGLSLLGFGVQPPIPSLGKLILQGVIEANLAWWEALFPIFILVIIMIITFILTKNLKIRY